MELFKTLLFGLTGASLIFWICVIAKKDTFISVTNEEVLSTLNQRISTFIDVFGSAKALEDTMKMSISSIKKEYSKVVEEELFVEKFRYLNFKSYQFLFE